jgi:predicted Fe-S protein YdhL (DUF1289 family)
MNDIEKKTSPCIGVCEYEEVADGDVEKTCKGCSRTAEEIEEWFFATENRRKEILKKCQQRKREEEYKKELTVVNRTAKMLRQSNQ